jgi:hypothetical protein
MTGRPLPCTHYNTECFPMALRGETPAERLATKLEA